MYYRVQRSHVYFIHVLYTTADAFKELYLRFYFLSRLDFLCVPLPYGYNVYIYCSRSYRISGHHHHAPSDFCLALQTQTPLLQIRAPLRSVAALLSLVSFYRSRKRLHLVIHSYTLIVTKNLHVTTTPSKTRFECVCECV